MHTQKEHVPQTPYKSNHQDTNGTHPFYIACLHISKGTYLWDTKYTLVNLALHTLFQILLTSIMQQTHTDNKFLLPFLRNGLHFLNKQANMTILPFLHFPTILTIKTCMHFMFQPQGPSVLYHTFLLQFWTVKMCISWSGFQRRLNPFF